MANAEIQSAINSIQSAFVKVAAGRQSTVTAALVMRQRGAVPAAKFLSQFKTARAALMDAATALDEQLDVIERADNASWLKIVAAFNTAAAKIPGVNISSPSVAEIIGLAVPPIPDALFSPSESAASQQAVRMELARYETRRGAGLNGLGNLGLFQAAVGAVTGSTCIAAAGAAGLVTAGVGAAVVGAGCLLLAVGAIVATTAVVIAIVRRLPTAAATSLAAADALEDATDQVSAACRENNLSSADCAALLKKAADNTKPPPSDTPWGWIALAAGGAALWFFWPAITAKVATSRARQGVAGLPRRRRMARVRRDRRGRFV